MTDDPIEPSLRERESPQERAARKPLGRKSYGHIGHLPGSRMGPSDHHCHEGQARIATEKTRDKHDEIIVQEKLDGSNVGIARIGDEIVPLSRAGYRAETSPYEQHHHFARWTLKQCDRWMSVLRDGERLCGEWLMQAHGTRYQLPHEPFVAFDLMTTDERTIFDEFLIRVAPANVVTPRLIHRGGPLSIEAALVAIEMSGHGALDPVEGVVWRVERNLKRGNSWVRTVDFLCKYVRPEKLDGIYLPEFSLQPAVWNWTDG